MDLPTLEGLIRRRILINYRADPDVVQSLLPAGFRPKLQRNHAVVGICLIRLEQVRPKGLPSLVGLSSENAAHRIAVQWDRDGLELEGVYIPRRDSNSSVNQWLGGRVFPGEHHAATFDVQQPENKILLAMHSNDQVVRVNVDGQISQTWPSGTMFSSLEEASSFFERGALGYSETHKKDHLDGILLSTQRWRVEALQTNTVSSSYFEDTRRFPKGSVVFDHALIMRDIQHQWHSAPSYQLKTIAATKT
jgi:hypothetical protein